MPSKFLFENLKEEGERLGIPKDKKRALVREYLQTRLIYLLYQEKESRFLSFIGGTSLRLLRNLDRFSEDLDFDNLGLSFQKVKKIFKKIVDALEKENFKIEFSFKKTKTGGIGNLKFVNLLSDFKITTDPKEKLVIKINYAFPKTKPNTETLILARFGFVQNVLTNTQDFILSQKFRAVLTRKDPQPRDFYDVLWLFSHQAGTDPKIFKELKVKNEKDLFSKVLKKYKKIRPRLKEFKRRLEPFLINPQNVRFLDVFKEVLRSKI